MIVDKYFKFPEPDAFATCLFFLRDMKELNNKTAAPNCILLTFNTSCSCSYKVHTFACSVNTIRTNFCIITLHL